MSTISVAITTYNRSQLLDKTLRSLAAQTRRPDELIISDDCSSDDTEAVVARWVREFPGLRYSRNERNLYMPGNLNRAVAMGTCDYIANLHDADEFHPTLLEKWAAALDRYPTAGFVFNGVEVLPRRPGGAPEVILHDVAPFTSGREFFQGHMLHQFASIVWGTVMARRSAYEELLPFDQRFGFISDVDMWMRMCLRNDVAYVAEPLIVLDCSPTYERTFRWSHVEACRSIQLVNIHRFFGSQPRLLDRELRLHGQLVRRIYLRWLLNRIKRLDWKGFREGVAVCRRIGWPNRVTTEPDPSFSEFERVARVRASTRG